jgi:hypothetical protein
MEYAVIFPMIYPHGSRPNDNPFRKFEKLQAGKSQKREKGSAYGVVMLHAPISFQGFPPEKLRL